MILLPCRPLLIDSDEHMRALGWQGRHDRSPHVQVTTGLGSQQKLSNFDTYCMVSCSGGDVIGDNFASEPGGEHAAPFSLASDREP